MDVHENVVKEPTSQQTLGQRMEVLEERMAKLAEEMARLRRLVPPDVEVGVRL